MEKIKRIAILGASGMLGHMVYHVLKSETNHNIIPVVRQGKISDEAVILDVMQKDELINTLKHIKPDVVINCIGILIKGSSDNSENAIYINAYFPHQLSNLGKQFGFNVIHISTDCVFNGKKGNYTVNDDPDAKDMYGKSKALGELINDRDLTIRTSIIGPELKSNGEGLLNWFISQKGDVSGYSRAIWTGLTTLELARTIKFLLQESIHGLYQIVPDLPINKYELLKLFKKNFSKAKVDHIRMNGEVVIDKSLISNYSMSAIKSYDLQLKDLAEFMMQHKELYKQYFS
ncbi:dTDP-4-dehydrorhamnose reductase family protein [Saccharicrinis sp. FJH62]|uniref:dTDP-4-dehydrorhamnose reductase family protein n=1 Tax=Saccharicrinis sp. FJH62 TaxID=3344657 RepID=UPI0035D44058